MSTPPSPARDELSPVPDRFQLRGRHALVTGAASGIGRAVALAFGRAGACLALCDRDSAGLTELARTLEAAGVPVLARALDVRAPEAPAFVTAAAAHFGGLHVLVNNAGGTFRSDFAALSDGGERAIREVNYGSVVRMTRTAIERLEAPASIVNVTSVEAHRAAPGYTVYAAMKAAVESLSRSLALELADRGVRVNCVAPDAIPTPGTGGAAPPTPLSEPGEPDDVAAAVLFLASDAARFVTGTTLHVDGGTHAAGGWRRGADGRFGL